MKPPNDNFINCFDCVHFSVTWEPKFPKSCSFYGFKTSTHPANSVFEATGSACVGFEKKEREEPEKK